MMKKKDIQAMLDNHLQIETEINQNRDAITNNSNMEYDIKLMKLDSLNRKADLNLYTIFLLKHILEA